MKKIIKALPKVRFHGRAKVNKGTNVHRCRHCLELSTFRVFQANGVNMLACVMCLNSCRYNKSKPIHKHSIVRTTPLTFKDKVNRQWLRIKVYFTGNHIYGPFKRRRKK